VLIVNFDPMTDGSFSNPIFLLIYMQIPTGRARTASSEGRSLTTEDPALTNQRSLLTTHYN